MCLDVVCCLAWEAVSLLLSWLGGRLVVFEVSGVGGCGVGEGVGDDEGDLVVLASWTVYQSTLSVWKE